MRLVEMTVQLYLQPVNSYPIPGSQIQAKPINWLWNGWVPSGGSGNTSVLRLAAAVANLKRLGRTGSEFGVNPVEKTVNFRWEWKLPAAERAK